MELDPNSTSKKAYWVDMKMYLIDLKFLPSFDWDSPRLSSLRPKEKWERNAF